MLQRWRGISKNDSRSVEDHGCESHNNHAHRRVKMEAILNFFASKTCAHLISLMLLLALFCVISHSPAQKDLLRPSLVQLVHSDPSFVISPNWPMQDSVLYKNSNQASAWASAAASGKEHLKKLDPFLSAPQNPNLCIIQPILSAPLNWTEDMIPNHTGLHEFFQSFVKTMKHPPGPLNVQYSIYYGFDYFDPVFSNGTLKKRFKQEALNLLGVEKAARVRIFFKPMYALENRLTAIWNNLADHAYHDGCDYFFMSNDDMVLYSDGWAEKAISILQAGTFSNSTNVNEHMNNKRRMCRNLGIVRFVDEWKDWALFTFHISSRTHLEIFDVYYPVPYKNSHNDYWIHRVYNRFGLSILDSKIHVRNRVQSPQTSSDASTIASNNASEADPRYKYDRKDGIVDVVYQGQKKLYTWLEQHRDLCDAKPYSINSNKKGSKTRL